MKTAQDLEGLLTGARVRLWPYSAAQLPRDVLYRVWQLIERERGWAKLCWWQPVPAAQRGDLATFASSMRDKIPLLVQDLATGELCGLMWFDEVVPGLRANLSIWFARAAWGPAATEAGHIATRYGHECLGLKTVWGVTPWPAARAYAARCGYQPVATLPDWVLINGQRRAMHYLRHEE